MNQAVSDYINGNLQDCKKRAHKMGRRRFEKALQEDGGFDLIKANLICEWAWGFITFQDLCDRLHALEKKPEVPRPHRPINPPTDDAEDPLPRPTKANPMDAKHPRPSHLPPDPEGQNEERADWAYHAVRRFREVCRGDREDAVRDLICNLGHYCDRHGFDLNDEIRIGSYHYEEETGGKGMQFQRVKVGKRLPAKQA